MNRVPLILTGLVMSLVLGGCAGRSAPKIDQVPQDQAFTFSEPHPVAAALVIDPYHATPLPALVLDRDLRRPAVPLAFAAPEQIWTYTRTEDRLDAPRFGDGFDRYSRRSVTVRLGYQSR